MPQHTMTPGDEAAVRTLYRCRLESWARGDAEAYAAQFTEDADYIVAGGIHEHGRREIVAGHQEVFDTWAKGSRLAGEIVSLRALAPGVALLIACGSIVLPDARESDSDGQTIYSLVAVRRDGMWRFAAYQNTPVERHV